MQHELIKKFKYEPQMSANKLLPDVKKTYDSWFSPDKGLHLVGSMISTIATTKSIERFGNKKTKQATFVGMGFTLSLGLGKEVWDSRSPKNIFSTKDLFMDVLGTLIGGLLVSLK